MSVGMPATLYLQQFGEYVLHAFGHVCYHVGSSMDPMKKDGWRDVDVRLLLPDVEYARWGFGDPEYPQHNKRWCATVLAWTTFGRHLTGLPIDFQIQQQSHANAKEKKSRSALFLLSNLEEGKYPKTDAVQTFPGGENAPALRIVQEMKSVEEEQKK